MRVLLDTNVLVRANKRATGPAREVLIRVSSAPHTLVMSPFILTEVVRVLNYPRVQAQYRLGTEEIEEFADDLQRLAELIDPLPTTPGAVIRRDPDDNPIIQAAVLGQVEVICTLDRHFRHPDVMQFCAEHSIRIVTDVELLQLLRTADKHE
jgi:putative PIN family toxin of toxin-antitoxin system